MPTAYDGFVLRRGDSDSLKYWGGQSLPFETHTSVAELQKDLFELGFGLVPDLSNPADPYIGEFQIRTEWAVREFQTYAKMPYLAKEDPDLAAIVEPLLRRVGVKSDGSEVPVYQGPVSGVVNAETAAAIKAWVSKKYRCPVVVCMFVRTPANGPPHDDDNVYSFAPNGRNLWIESVPASKGSRRSRDFTRHFSAPASGGTIPPSAQVHLIWVAPSEATFRLSFVGTETADISRSGVTPLDIQNALDAKFGAGKFEVFGFADGPWEVQIVANPSVGETPVIDITGITNPSSAVVRLVPDWITLGVSDKYQGFTGPLSTPPFDCIPEMGGEALPHSLTGMAASAVRNDPNTASTYHVIRALSEVECRGHLDSINAYDCAMISVGLFHWALASARKIKKKDGTAAYPCSPLELPAILALNFRRNQAADAT